MFARYFEFTLLMIAQYVHTTSGSEAISLWLANNVLCLFVSLPRRPGLRLRLQLLDTADILRHSLSSCLLQPFTVNRLCILLPRVLIIAVTQTKWVMVGYWVWVYSGKRLPFAALSIAARWLWGR